VVVYVFVERMEIGHASNGAIATGF